MDTTRTATSTLTVPADPSTDDPFEALTYEQTVPRSLVHRWSLSEVFLTGSRAEDEQRFSATAQLPLSHAYFRDHPDQLLGFHDPLNVLEAARQAVTCAAHLHQGVPRATTFMVTSWKLDLAGPEALACGPRPGELRIDGTVPERKVRGGHLRRLVFDMELTLDDHPLGRLSMDVSCTPTDQYHVLRRMQRGGDVPTAFTLPADPAGTPAAPAELGRRDPLNVVLDDVQRSDEGLSAVLSPRTFRNRSMYDHPYDHVPAMVLSEAARQCALLLGRYPGAGCVLSLDGSFDKFAELDAPVHLAARHDTEQGPGHYLLTATQADATVARITLALG